MKHVLITGGSRGIGASAALHCAQRGMGVILTYNAQPHAAQLVVERIQKAARQWPCSWMWATPAALRHLQRR